MVTHTPTTPGAQLIHGEFAPVYWEPLGRRGERLVVGVIVVDDLGLAQAHVTLQHKRLLDFISTQKSESGAGVITFTFDHFNKTLSAGGVIEDLRAPFSSMSIGRAEAVSARSPDELVERATRLSTLIGHMPEPPSLPDASRAAARTLSFVRNVRQQIAKVDKKLAREAMGTKQFYPVGSSQMRLHFHYDMHYAQFCSLPLPSAKPELATECQARIGDLVLIRAGNPNADVALCINTHTLQQAGGQGTRKNAAHIVHQRTLDYANAMKIPVREYSDPAEAAKFLRDLAHID